MQSDGNSFDGDVGSDIFETFRDKDNNLDQIYKSKYVRIIFGVNSLKYFTKMHTNTINSITKTQFYGFLVVMCYNSLNMHFL